MPLYCSSKFLPEPTLFIKFKKFHRTNFVRLNKLTKFKSFSPKLLDSENSNFHLGSGACLINNPDTEQVYTRLKKKKGKEKKAHGFSSTHIDRSKWYMNSRTRRSLSRIMKLHATLALYDFIYLFRGLWFMAPRQTIEESPVNVSALRPSINDTIYDTKRD